MSTRRRVNVKIAVAQRPPVLHDLPKSLESTLASLHEAADQGARLVVFPEAHLPGYPTWAWRLRPGGDIKIVKEVHAKLRANAVDLERGDLQPLCDAAAQRQVTVVCGMNELESRFSGTTLFNTVVTIGPDGRILNRHRKLLPTNPERMVWGRGDASGLRVVDTPVGRIGALICWESYMPLARYALYAQNIEIYVAPTWDTGEGWLASMRHIAKEGGCWVVATATALQARDIPADFPHRERLFPDDEEWINDGDAVVVRPFGAPVAGPLTRDKSILYAEIDVDQARDARRSLDVTGHYSRPDVFELHVNRRAMPPASFEDD